MLTLDLIKEREGQGVHSEDDESVSSHGSSGTRRSSGKQRHDGKNNEVTASKLVIFSLGLLVLLHFSTKLYINLLNGSAIGAIFAFYTAVVIGIALPLDGTKWIRLACGTVGHRALELVNPRCFCFSGGHVVPRAIPFIDVFFADAMCSVSTNGESAPCAVEMLGFSFQKLIHHIHQQLSKVFFDWGMLWHLAWHYPEPVPTELHSILIPSVVASLPYLIRARQCLVMYTIGYMKVSR